MPSYTYFCTDCGEPFEIFFYFKDYKDIVDCQKCGNNCKRYYQEDMLSINSSVRKSDSELKTIGDLANRNRDRMNEDQRQDLYNKHNAYKDQESTKELPSGMSRIKKSKTKIKWR